MTTSMILPSEPVDTQERPWTLGASFTSLIIALAVAALTLSIIGTALHLFDPRFTFSLVRAAHQSWAWISILILSVVWLGTGVFHVIRSAVGQRQEREPATPAGGMKNRAGIALFGAKPGPGIIPPAARHPGIGVTTDRMAQIPCRNNPQQQEPKGETH